MPPSPQIATDVGARLRRSIAEMEQEREALAHLGHALDDYRYAITDRVCALCMMLTRLRREAARYEFMAQSNRRAA